MAEDINKINEAIAGMNTAEINEELKKLDPAAELLTDEAVEKLKETLQNTPEDELKKIAEEIANVSGGGLDSPFNKLAANHPTVVKVSEIFGAAFVTILGAAFMLTGLRVSSRGIKAGIKSIKGKSALTGGGKPAGLDGDAAEEVFPNFHNGSITIGEAIDNDADARIPI
jgi:hypothetical protein